MAVEKRFVCSFCARVFSRSEHKQRHERSHTNEKPFHCMYCTSAFVRRDLLQRHCRSIHKKDVQKNEKALQDKEEMRNNEVKEEKDIRKKGCVQLNHGLLLFVSGKIRPLLQYNEDQKMLIAGYISLIQISEEVPAVQEILQDLIEYLQFHEVNEIDESNLCLIYATLSVGSITGGSIDSGMDYFERAWSVLVNGLVAKYNSNQHTDNKEQLHILSMTFMLAYIHVNYDLGLHKAVDLNVIMSYLNDIGFIIMSNFAGNKAPSRRGLTLFWSIYNFLSTYFVYSLPPKCYKLFLEGDLVDSDLLAMVNGSQNLSMNDRASCETVLSTICNMLNSRQLTDTRVTLLGTEIHNAVILIHKNSNKSSSSELYDIFKTNLLLQCPIQFREILDSYILNPHDYTQWRLLTIILKESNFKCYRPLNIKTMIERSNEIEEFLYPFFGSATDINNNIGIVSVPLLFNLQFTKFPKLNILNLKEYNAEIRKNLVYFIIEWYLTMVKVLINAWKDKKYMNNGILQCLLFLINNNSLDYEFDAKFFWFVYSELASYYDRWIALLDHENISSDFTLKVRPFLLNYVKSALLYELGTEASSTNQMKNQPVMLPPLLDTVQKHANFVAGPL